MSQCFVGLHKSFLPLKWTRPCYCLRCKIGLNISSCWWTARASTLLLFPISSSQSSIMYSSSWSSFLLLYSTSPCCSPPCWSSPPCVVVLVHHVEIIVYHIVVFLVFSAHSSRWSNCQWSILSYPRLHHCPGHCVVVFVLMLLWSPNGS
jgi:hypothetical protein